MKKIFAVTALMILLIIPQLGCNAKAPNNNQAVSKTSFHLDTVCTITIYAMDGVEGMSQEDVEKEALRLITDGFKLCDSYERIMSKTVEGSDIYKLNGAEGLWTEVSSHTAEVIEKGVEYGRLSGGAFDITIGEVTELWDFHEEDEAGDRTGRLPDEKALAEAVSHVNYENVELDGNKVRIKGGAQIDLGGIAKGYIADRVAEFLEEKGVTGAVVDLGGNIVVIGGKTDRMSGGDVRDFAIGIADPLSERGELIGTVACRDKTLVTSGTYERYFELDGVKYHHVLDPETGYPVETDLLSVTIIGERGASADCDGLSTACLALGKDKAAKLIEDTEGVGAVLVDADGRLTVINVPGFREA